MSRRLLAMTTTGIAIVAVAASGIAAAATQSDNRSSQRHSVEKPSPPRFDNYSAALAATAISKIGRRDTHFTGVIIDAPRDRLIVYRTPGQQQVTYPAHAEGIAVVVAPAQLTSKQVARTEAALMRARRKLSGEGVNLDAVTDDGRGNVTAHIAPTTLAAKADVRRLAPYPGSLRFAELAPVNTAPAIGSKPGINTAPAPSTTHG